MWLDQIWRFPVKSMAGERIAVAELTSGGIAGDRNIIAVDSRGRSVNARRHGRMLGMHATTSDRGDVLVDGLPWDDPVVRQRLREASVPDAELMQYDGPERFDILPLLITSDGALKAFGHDPRRLRPNLVIGGVEGLAERLWEGRRLRVGSAIIHAVDLRGRCPMTTWDPVTLAQDRGVLRDIGQRFDGTFCLNTEVEVAATIREGDEVALLD